MPVRIMAAFGGSEIAFGPVFDEIGTVPDEVWQRLTKEKKTMLPAMKSVTSSNIEAVGHDGSDLYVKFKDGMTYVHKAVPEDVHKEMMDADSVGKFYHARIKGKFESQKLAMSDPKPVHDDQGKPHPMNASQK